MIDLVIFGATGDLAARKLFPAIYELEAAGYLPEELRIVGVGRKPWSEHEFDKSVREALAEFQKNLEADVVERFIRRTTYRQMDFSPESFEALAKDSAPSSIFYLSLPPDAFPVVGTGLGEAGLAREKGNHFRRLVIEKPFGHDLQSALELQATLTKHWDESQILRIDHFLGKETVQNILVLRFANQLFELLWNHLYIDNVQITVAETLGLEGRGAYFDESGIVRDVVQNHALQILTLIAMEPPVSLEADSIRDEKVKALRSIRPFTPEDVRRGTVRGQYVAGRIGDASVPGYREEEGVAPDSHTESFAALRFWVDNWRWAGVPFYVRAGKRLPTRVTQIVMQLKDAPDVLFARMACAQVGPNRLTIRVQPNEGAEILMSAKEPGPGMIVSPVRMRFDYSEAFGKQIPDAYERLLLNALQGDPALFARDDEVEEAWELITPLLQTWRSDHVPPEPYPAGAWGPPSADALLQADGRRWWNPDHNGSAQIQAVGTS